MLWIGIALLPAAPGFALWWQLDHTAGGLETLAPGPTVGLAAAAAALVVVIGAVLLGLSSPSPRPGNTNGP